MNINIYALVVFLLMLGVIFYKLGYKIIGPVLEKEPYWKIGLKIAVPLIMFGVLCRFFMSTRDCSNEAILISGLITVLFLPIILIRKEVQAKVKKLKGGKK